MNNNIYYHGSKNKELKKLQAKSPCHTDIHKDKLCAYVTDNYAYALLYIRDMDINYVTACVKDNIVYYEEQFDNQLKTLYQGQKGYIYSTVLDKTFLGHSDGIMYSLEDIPLSSKKHIDNAYTHIKEEIEKGNIIITKISQEKYNGLIDKLVEKLIKNNLYKDNKKLQNFYTKNFPIAFDKAKLSIKQGV